MLRSALLIALVAVAAADIKSDVKTYFKKNFPNKVDKLDSIMASYAGKEEALMKKLVFENTQLKVHAHYTKFKPKALDNVAKIVEANYGKEAELLKSLDKKEKEIAQWRKKIYQAYRSMGTPATLIDEQVDSALQKWYGRESKLLKNLQKEGASGGGDADTVSDTGSSIFGGFLDLLFLGGLGGLLYIAVYVVIPMANAADVKKEKPKKEKKESKGGSTKKKR